MRNLSRLEYIAKQIREQDNRITANPIFIVQQRHRQYGIDPNYCEDIIWLHSDEGEPVDDDEAERLEAEFKKTGDEPDGYTRTAYIDSWEFVTACFTEEGCKDYLRSNGHNLKEPRIYVESGFRNREWEFMREYLMGIEVPVS